MYEKYRMQVQNCTIVQLYYCTIVLEISINTTIFPQINQKQKRENETNKETKRTRKQE